MPRAADRFDPHRSVPEIDPHRPDRASAADGAADASEPAFDPWARRSAASTIVRSTGALRDAPAPSPPPPAFERIAPGELAGREAKRGPYADAGGRRNLKGRKAIRAWNEEQEARRLAAEEAERRAADRESRGLAGFADRTSRSRGVSISNPHYAPATGYEADAPAPPKPPKPWHRRFAIMVPVSILVIAALAVGLGWPAYLQIRATSEADRAAADFEHAMQSYRTAWTPANLDALVAPAPSTSIADADDPLAQPADAQRALDGQCGKLDAASRAATALATAPPPTLGQTSGHDFSGAYQEAMTADAEFATERQGAQTLLDAIRATMPQLQRFCANFRLGVADVNMTATRDASELQPLRTVPTGAVMTVGSRTMTCEEAAGCPDYADESARKTYSELWRKIAEEHDTTLATHYEKQCWLDALTPYCVLMRDAENADRETLQGIASSMGSESPSQDPASPPLPKLQAALEAQRTRYGEAERAAYLEAGKVDPAVLVDASPAWEAHMIVRLLGEFEAHLAEGASGYRAIAGV